ncbi:hypothetical protein, partial [Vibrio sp. F13]|uniref:hypothetical protein n=1 Tax=Vibrio sp. F13 TaxID=2070777 RepID=UPI0010BD2671
MDTPLQLLLATAVVISLTACSDVGSPVTSTQTRAESPIQARDGVIYVEPDVEHLVSVAPFVDAGETRYELTSLYPLSNNSACNEANIEDAHTFSITLDEGVSCHYEYHVELIQYDTDAGSQEKTGDSGELVIIASDSPAPRPIPQSVIVGESITFHLPTLLGADFPTDYILDDNATVLGDGSAVADSGNNEITLTAYSQGISRIVYTLNPPTNNRLSSRSNRATNEREPSQPIFGTIDIAVSALNNPPPVADNFTEVQEPDIAHPIDVNIAPHVTSTDGDDVQLVYLNSFYGSVTAKDPENLTNSIFSFQANDATQHYVSYAVSDHKGGFDTAIAEIRVRDPNQEGLWQAILNGNEGFTAPLTLVEANDAGLRYSGTLFDTNYTPTVNMSVYDSIDASNLCASTRLPTSSELHALFQSESPTTKHNWPGASYYLSNDAGAYKVVSLSTGDIKDAGKGSYYVTCWY